MHGQHSVTGYGRAVCAALVVLFATVVAAPGFAEEKKPVQTGTVKINSYQLSFIGSGQLGSGEITFEGKTYPFKIGGLGIGGIGVSSIDATGEVYDLKNIEDFYGGFSQARAGIVVGTASKGSLWLENPRKVFMRLTADRAGVALSVGLDGMVIKKP